MIDLVEFRYPFTSVFEYFSTPWRDAAAVHLNFAWVALLIVCSLLLLQQQAFGCKLLALYFGLTMFNNPAFQVAPGASLGDCFGVVGAIYYGLFVVLKGHFTIRSSVVGVCILCAGLAMAAHALWIAVCYPILNADGAGLTRCLVLLKVFVLGACCCMFEAYVKTGHDCYWIIKQILNLSLIGLACYFLQAGMLLAGHISYGTFMDAGFVGFPAFGSVSQERGHLGKFMTPLFPIFLIMFLRRRKRIAFFSFLLVTLLNFSASSLSFFFFYAVSTAWQFRKNLFIARYAAFTFSAIAALIVFVTLSWTLWVGLAHKVRNQGIDGEGGRSVSVLITYLEQYPMGISYGGSQLRTPPDLPDMNSGLYSFVAQQSLLAIPLIGAFLYLVYMSASACRHIPDLYLRRALKTGILIMPFIFFSDVLWFVPTIWLPMLLARQLSGREQPAQLLTFGNGMPSPPSRIPIGARWVGYRLLGANQS
jgi:hypothetical protein